MYKILKTVKLIKLATYLFT